MRALLCVAVLALAGCDDFGDRHITFVGISPPTSERLVRGETVRFHATVRFRNGSTTGSARLYVQHDGTVIARDAAELWARSGTVSLETDFVVPDSGTVDVYASLFQKEERSSVIDKFQYRTKRSGRSSETESQKKEDVDPRANRWNRRRGPKRVEAAERPKRATYDPNGHAR